MNSTEIKELKYRVKSPLISIRNGMIVDTHQLFPPDKKEDPAMIKTIASNISCTLSPFSMLGWLRGGVTAYLISEGISPCHGYDLTTVSKTGERAKNVVEDLEKGYHKKRMGKGGEANKEKPECEVVMGEPCLTYRMFGGFTAHHRVFSMVAFKTSPVKDRFYKQKENITGTGNYRRINVSPRTSDGITPYNTYEYDVLANVDGIQYLRMYEDDDVYVGMLLRAIEYLYAHRNDFGHQLGGSRTFGHGFIEPVVINPLYTRAEAVNYAKLMRKAEEDFDSDNIAEVETKGEMAKKDETWVVEHERIMGVLDDELKRQKDLFGIDKHWWSIEL